MTKNSFIAEVTFNTSHQFLVNNVSNRNNICQGYSTEIFDGLYLVVIFPLFTHVNICSKTKEGVSLLLI